VTVPDMSCSRSQTLNQQFAVQWRGQVGSYDMIFGTPRLPDQRPVNLNNQG
jgi:hypothetical protein